MVSGASGIAGAQDDGWSGAAFALPRIQGADACGRIVAVGAPVDRARRRSGAILNCLKRGGRYGVAGAISGPLVDLDLRTLYLKDLHLIGCTVLEPEVFPNLIGYIERADIKPLVAATYPLANIVAAQEAFLTKRHVGKIVLTL